MEQYHVTGMTCAACSSHVEKAVKAVDGVSSVTVSLLTNAMSVEGTASPQAVIAAVEKAGYGASLAGAREEEATTAADLTDHETPKLKKRLIASLCLLLPLMYITMGHMMWNWPLPGFLAGNHVAMGLTELLLTAMVMGAVCIVGSLTHYFTTKERVVQISDDEDHVSARSAAKMLFRCKSWVLNMLYIICYGVNNVLIMSSITYYATYVMGSTGAATIIQAVYLVVSIITTVLTGPLDRLLGRKRTMIFAAAVLILGKVWFVIDPFAVGAIYLNAVTVGIGLSITFVMFNTNRNNIADLIEWQSGRRIDSLVSTGDNLAAKLAQAGATQLLTLSLHMAGFNEALPAQPDATIATINALLGWVPAAVTFVMLAVLCAMNIEKDMDSMNAEKAARGISVSG